MRNRKKILISIFSLVLCVLVTFAWINEVQNPKGRVMKLELQNATISDSELDVKLSVNIEEDVFDEITQIYDENDPDQKPESFSSFAPGARKKFKVDITNKSESSMNLRLLLSDIVCESEELQQNIIIGTNGFAGFDSNYPAPMVQNKRLYDGMDASGGFTLVDSVEIPPHNIDNPVTIYFYVMFSSAGTAELEDMSFSIGKINFLTL